MRRNQKVMSAAGILTAALCIGSLAGPVYADGPDSNVWIDVVQTPVEARISVTVPLSYGFAVIGSVQSGDSGPVSVEDGNLLLSNVRVEVSSPSNALPEAPGFPEYSVHILSEAALPVRNYSTDVRDENINLVNLKREGLAVRLEPYMVAVTDGISHHWKPSAAVPTTDDSDFKKFRMELDGLAFSEADTTSVGGTIKDIIRLGGGIELAAPPDVPQNGYTAAGTANIPSEKYLEVNVKVGGKQNQYKQVEQSLKVGEIHWLIIPGETTSTP